MYDGTEVGGESNENCEGDQDLVNEMLSRYRFIVYYNEVSFDLSVYGDETIRRRSKVKEIWTTSTDT